MIWMAGAKPMDQRLDDRIGNLIAQRQYDGAQKHCDAPFFTAENHEGQHGQRHGDHEVVFIRDKGHNHITYGIGHAPVEKQEDGAVY